MLTLFARTQSLRALRLHLIRLLLALGFLFIGSQLALASHDCGLAISGDTVMAQHMGHLQSPAMPGAHANSPGCEKHCVPDLAQKETVHLSLAALPVAGTLAVAQPPCPPVIASHWSLTPPAAGPPATLRFCRFRE